MPINFPNTPVLNDIYVFNERTYVYDGQKWGIQLEEGGGSSATSYQKVTNIVQYTATTTLANAFTSTDTSLVKSIHVTNYGANPETITAQWTDASTATTYNIVTSMPIPSGQTVDLLHNFKVLNNTDNIKIQGSANSTLSCLISYELSEDTGYFQVGKKLTTDTDTEVFQTLNVNGSILTSLLIQNIAIASNTVTVTWKNNLDAFQGYLCYDMVIPENGNLELLLNSKFLPANHKIFAQASSANAIDVILSGYNE